MTRNLIKKSNIISAIFICLIVTLLLASGDKPKIVSAAAEETSCSNPVIWADVPDVDVIRVGNYYYMSSTSMHMMPGVPIMRSTDLVNWEIVSYVYDTLENNAAHNLTDGKGIYGKGSWATSLRYNNGTFYVCFASNDMGRTYIYQTADIINGPWTRSNLSGIYHDPSLLFDDDGRVYIVYGSGTISIKELTSDATAVKSGGLSKVLFNAPDSSLFEGSHIYKINGMYYIFIIRWPANSRRIEACYRSSSLTGAWESKIVLDSTLSGASGGVAQGGVVSTADGYWYAMLFQDHGAVGRCPVLVPIAWTDNWPIMGVNGGAPVTMTIPLSPSSIKTALLISDDFNQTKLGLNWQWNHNPDNNYWSLSVRPGYLRLTTGSIASNIFLARNTLSQRTVGPTCSGEVAIETNNMKSGDYTGLAAFQDDYGIIGVKKTDSGKYLIMAINGGSGTPSEVASIALYQDKLYLKISFNFLNCADKATFYYSLDGSAWTQFGSQLSMTYKLTHFMGYRIALFNYATKSTGGYVDFDYLHTTPTSTPVGSVNRISSYNFPAYYIRHLGVGAQATIASNLSPVEDSQWKVVPGLADSSCVSFESVNYPGYFLRHRNYLIYLDQNDGSTTFKADATFREVAGLKDSSWKSYQSYNYPSRYLRHQSFLLRIDPISASSSDLDKQDATFKQL